MRTLKNQVPDHTITQRVTAQLSNRGLRSPCHISVQTNNGMVTLSGSVQYAHQKQTALQAARNVDGSRGISDQLQVTPAGRKWE
jgi:osmotically-inducible protein OsmY